MAFLDSIFKKKTEDEYGKSEIDVLKDTVKALQNKVKQSIETIATLEETNSELKDEVINLQSENDELKNDSGITEDRVNELIELRLEKVSLRQKLLNKSLIEIIHVQDENFQLVDVEIDQRKTDIGIVNKNVDVVHDQLKEEVKKINTKIDGLLELMSEKIVKKESMPNIFSKDVNLRQLWDNMSDKKDAALLSIVYMMKKHFDEKGVRLK